MDFLAFNIQSYNRPYIETKLISDDSKFRRGSYWYQIRTRDGHFTVQSKNSFELAGNTLYIQGRYKEYDGREQRTSVRNFIRYNTALVIVNKLMKVSNP